MNYISSKKAAQLWNISTSRIVKLASTGRIDGAVLVGKSWMIPQDAQKPADARTKAIKKIKNDPVFRFPLYFLKVYTDETYAQLTAEEKELLKAVQLYETGEFSESRVLLEKLLKSCDNIYFRIGILYTLSNVYLLSGAYEQAESALFSMQMIFRDDFPHKAELLYILRDKEAPYVSTQYFVKDFDISPDFNYTEETEAYLTLLCMRSSLLKYLNASTELSPDAYELACRRFEHTGFFYVAMYIHFELAIYYRLRKDSDLSLWHMQSALKHAVENRYFTSIALLSVFCSDLFVEALQEYPEELRTRLMGAQKDYSDLATAFLKQRDAHLQYSQLTASDYSLIYYALKGYPNKDIAVIEGLSLPAINQRYAKLYTKLNVDGKKELADLFRNSDSAENAML